VISAINFVYGCAVRNFLDIKRLRYFRAIAEAGSLSAAARALNLAQPALSHHVTELESALGLRLLERRHDGVALTEAGRLLLRHATDITGRVERAEAELRSLAATSTRVKIRLAVISSFAADLTPLLIETLARDMPEVVLRITESGTLDSRELLERGAADVAICLDAEGRDNSAVLAAEQLYLVSAAGEAASGPVPFAEALRRPLVMPALGNPFRTFVETAAASAGIGLHVVLEVDGFGPRRNAVLAGFGSTIFGGHTVYDAAQRTGLSVRPISAPTLHRTIYLAWRRGLDPALVERLRHLVGRSLVGLGGIAVEPQPALTAAATSR
jgi:molybdate transport repressor ModE-like protein